MAGRELTERATRQVAGLRRDPEHGRLGGVCVAIATATGVDLALVRIGMVVLALSGGLGVALYACAWLMLPDAHSDTFPLAHVAPSTAHWDLRRRLLVTTIVSGLTWLVLGSWLPFAPVPLIVALVLLLVQQQKARAARAREVRHAAASTPSTEVPPSTQQFAHAVDAWRARVEQLDAGQQAEFPSVASGQCEGARADHAQADLPGDHVARSVPAPHSPTPGMAPERGATNVTPGRRRPPRYAGLLAGALVAAVAATVGGITSRISMVHVNPVDSRMLGAAAALAVIGLALVVLSTTPVRPRLLVPLGLVLCLLIGSLQTGLATPDGHWRTGQYGTGSPTDPLQLTGVRAVHELTPAPGGQPVTVQVRAAHVVLTVPNGLGIHLHYRLRAANLTTPTNRAAGSLNGSLDLPAQAGQQTFTVNLDAMAAHVEVRRA